MSKNAQAFDGRESMAFILEPTGTEKTSSTGLVCGDIGYITAKASSSSAFGDAPLMSLFIAPATVTLASGDKFMPVTPYFLGFANDKSLTMAKNTQEATMDYDKITNNVTNGIISLSGSIGGFAVVEDVANTTFHSAINLIRSRFTSISQIDDEGSVTYKASDTTQKDNLLIMWNIRSAVAGELVSMDHVPALFSNLSLSAANGSTQPFSVDYTGNDCDENGYTACNLQVEMTTALKTAIIALTARPAA